MKTIDEISKEPYDQLLSRSWFNLIRAHRYLYPKVERKLRPYGIDSPIWYEILLEIMYAGTQGARAHEIKHRLQLPQFSISRHLARMEKKGLVTTLPDVEDRRVLRVYLTDKSRSIEAELWPHYLEIIKEELGQRLNKEEAFELVKLLIKLYD